MIDSAVSPCIRVVWHQVGTKRMNTSIRGGKKWSTRLSLPSRRNHITQNVRIAGKRTLNLSVHGDKQPVEVFHAKGPDCSSELIDLYDIIARLMSLALQHGAPLEKVVDLLAGAKFAPCSPLSGMLASNTALSVPGLTGSRPVSKSDADPTVNYA